LHGNLVLNDFSFLFFGNNKNLNIFSCLLLAARVGRKRGKMNLEKTINKNIFDIPTAMRDPNPLSPNDSLKNELIEQNTSTHLSSILHHPKQKLTAQFKRAITLMKQRSEPTQEIQTSISITEKSNCSLDPILLTSLVEETSQTVETVITLDPTIRLNESNQNPSTKLMKPISTTPATLAPTPSSTATSGELRVRITNM